MNFKNRLKRSLSSALIVGTISTCSCTTNLENVLGNCVPLADHEWVQYGDLIDVLVLELEYDKGRVSQTGIYSTPLYFFEDKDQPNDKYHARLVSSSGENIFVVKFDFPLEVTDVPVTIDQANVQLYIPIRSDAEKIEIYDRFCEKRLGINVRGIVDANLNEIVYFP